MSWRDELEDVEHPEPRPSESEPELSLFYLEDGERFRDLRRPAKPWDWDGER